MKLASCLERTILSFKLTDEAIAHASFTAVCNCSQSRFTLSHLSSNNNNSKDEEERKKIKGNSVISRSFLQKEQVTPFSTPMCVNTTFVTNIQMADLSCPRCLESQGCHLIPLYYHLHFTFFFFIFLHFTVLHFTIFILLLFFSLLQLFFLSCPFSWLFSPENASIFFVKRYAFWDDCWSLVCTACCHMALVSAIMHLHNIFQCFIVFVH